MNAPPIMKTRAARKRQRLILILVAGTIFALAIGLILFALSDQIVYFQSPTDIATGLVEPGVRVRVGGLVEAGKIKYEGNMVSFVITDQVHEITAEYSGILPDLFREGQGVVIEGKLEPSGIFTADTVLAKHDENYIPKEVAEALKESDHWKGDPSQ